MKYMKRRGLKLFAVAALLPVISSGALAQKDAQTQPQATITANINDPASQQLIERVRGFLANVPKNIYPIMLQRCTRAQLTRIQERSESRATPRAAAPALSADPTTGLQQEAKPCG